MKLVAYAQAYRQNSIGTASPGRLILMLFDGALRFMNTALGGFDDDDLIRRNETIHNNLIKTQAILNELQVSLDLARGGEFAQRMSSLYDFMWRQIQQANLRKDDTAIHVVIELLGGLRQSWAEMLTQSESGARPSATPQVALVASAA